jgi:hypothetical protein
MLKPPKVPLIYRVVTFTVALVIGLFTLSFYEAGAKFANAVTNYTRLASQQAAEEDAKARRVAAAKAQMFKDPGVVGVQIIAAPKKPEQPQ